MDEILRKIEGLQTLDTVVKTLGIKRQSALNLLSRLKKEGYVTVSGGGKKIRLYRITMRKQRPRKQGMFDILNKHSPHMKLAEWYDHQVHGKYGVEDALIDAIQTKSFRVVLVSLYLYRSIKDWKRVYHLAKRHDCWQQVGALYDVARLFFKVRRMPNRYYCHHSFSNKKYLVSDYTHLDKFFFEIEKKWRVGIPFKQADIQKVAP